MERANGSEMPAQRGDGRIGKQGVSILSTLSRPHKDFPTSEIDVLHPKLQTLEEPESASVKQKRRNSRRPA